MYYLIIMHFHVISLTQMRNVYCYIKYPKSIFLKSKNYALQIFLFLSSTNNLHFLEMDLE